MRSITFGGISSLSLGLTINCERTVTGGAPPRNSEEVIPFRDGTVDESFVDGNRHYDRRTLTYIFNIVGADRAEINRKRSQIDQWLSGTLSYLYDSDFPDRRFTRAKLSEPTELQFLSRNFRTATLTAVMTADPYMESISGTRTEIVQLAGRSITAYILANSVLCLGYTYPESPQMTAEISGTTMTLTYDLPGADYAGLRCFDVSGTPDFTLTGGTLGGDPVTLAGAHNFYCDVPTWNYTLRLTATVAEGASSPYVILAIGAGIAFAHDDSRRYAIDDYAVGTHTLKVSGQTAAFSSFTLPNGNYDTLEIVGEREGVYDLRYDSVERSL